MYKLCISHLDWYWKNLLLCLDFLQLFLFLLNFLNWEILNMFKNLPHNYLFFSSFFWLINIISHKWTSFSCTSTFLKLCDWSKIQSNLLYSSVSSIDDCCLIVCLLSVLGRIGWLQRIMSNKSTSSDLMSQYTDLTTHWTT